MRWHGLAATVTATVMVAALAGCAFAGPGADRCTLLDDPRTLPDALGETSGVVVSRAHPGIYWTHNDSGGDPRLYAVDSTGALVAEVSVTGARARDWEDLALAPCDAGECLYIGDIGDNEEKRRDLAIYRVPEPDPARDTTVEARRHPIRYADGPRDAEALFVLPDGGIHVITKGRSGPVALYRYPGPLREEQVALERLRTLDPGPVRLALQVTGADATPDGRWVAVRSYTTLQIYAVEAGELRPLDPPPGVDLRVLREPQGEAVAMADDGTVVLTSEGGLVPGPPGIWRLRCRLP